MHVHDVRPDAVGVALIDVVVSATKICSTSICKSSRNVGTK